MMSNKLPRMVVIAALAFTGSLSIQAQQQQASDSQKQPAKSTAAPAKPAVVWTDDNISSIRSASDIYLEQKRAAETAAAAQAADAAKPATKPTPKDHAPVSLSNPKTVESADAMIAWENRDIAAQQQFLQELQKRLEAAPADQQARLQQDLQQHAQTLAETQKERDGLVAQKQQIEKKASASSGTSSQSPSQQ